MAMNRIAMGVVLLGAAAGSARANPVLFTGSSGDLAASALFSASGTTLTITLANTSGHDVTDPAGLLHAVFFDVSGLPALGRGSANIGVGSGAWFDVVTGHGSSTLHTPTAFAPPYGYSGWNGVDVGSEFAFRNNLSTSGMNATPARYGLSSAGYGPFGPGDRFDTLHNLTGPDVPDGPDWGITSAADDLMTHNGGYERSDTPVVKNAVVFTLTNWPLNLDSRLAISNVWFQYGTQLTNDRVPGTPELRAVPLPDAGLMAALGVGAIAVRRRRAVC
jgi:hypothetical protein